MQTVAQDARKPRLRGVSHQVAFFVVTVAGPLLVARAPDAGTRVALIVYSLSLAGLFGCSALLHRGTWSPSALQHVRRLDHSMIYVFIAGTYTALIGLALPGQVVPVLVIVWVGAIAGAAFQLLWIDAPRWLTAGSYVALGWVAIFVLPDLLSELGAVGFGLVVAGGVLYTAGALVYAAKEPNPWPDVFGFHEVFHALVVAAVICHYVAIASWALPAATA
jgi:hemolysin III